MTSEKNDERDYIDRFATPTLAELYVKQGHYDKALCVYRDILKNRKPGNPPIDKAVSSLEILCSESGAKKEQDLANLFAEWIRRIKRYGYLAGK